MQRGVTKNRSPHRPIRGEARRIVDELDRTLRGVGDPSRAVKEKAYLKSPLAHYGASVPAIRVAVKDALAAHTGVTRRLLLQVVDALWSSSVHEHRMAAVAALEANPALLGPKDLVRIERMVRGSFTWAYVDGLAANVAGSLVEENPELADRLDRWANDDCFWVRRAALLALLVPIRRGAGDWKRFVRYADAMLAEREFFVRKAIGWVLREASKKRPDRVRRYVASRIGRLSGLTFREAVKRLPPADRRALLRAFEAREA